MPGWLQNSGEGDLGCPASGESVTGMKRRLGRVGEILQEEDAASSGEICLQAGTQGFRLWIGCCLQL